MITYNKPLKHFRKWWIYMVKNGLAAVKSGCSSGASGKNCTGGYTGNSCKNGSKGNNKNSANNNNGSVAKIILLPF